MVTPTLPSEYWIDPVTRSSLEAQARSLFEEAQAMLESASQLLSAESGLEPLTETLREFAKFSNDYFYLYKKRGDINEQQKALEKIQRELLTLRPLLEQRRVDHYWPYLKAADAIANDCIAMGGVQIKASKPQCLTLFEKTYHIARFVYSRVPGVAIPLANREDPWLWMGLAHEIGHYHFWNSRPGLGDELDGALLHGISGKMLEQGGNTPSNYASAAYQLSLWRKWKEELFADLFGTFLLGPAYVRSLMIWLRPRLTNETALSDDQDHPLPLLRPLIQAEALAMLEKELDELEAAQVKKEWQDQWAALAPNGKGFDYWLDQSLGETTVRDCVSLFPVVVSAMKSKAFNTGGEYYNSTTHAQVKEAANLLAERNGLSENPKIRPALKLPVVWYAWKQIISDGRLNTDEPQRLTKLREWIIPIPASAVRPQKSAIAVAIAAPNEVTGPNSESFKSLVRQKKADDPEATDEAIAERLLEDEFSTQEEAGGVYTPHSHSSPGSHSHYHPA